MSTLSETLGNLDTCPATAPTLKATGIIGLGRAGGSLDKALQQVGWSSGKPMTRGDSVESAAQDVDLVVIAVPDDSIGAVAQAIAPGPAVIAHMAGSRTLAVLAPHKRAASFHPLMSLPNAEVGAQRLLDNCTYAVAGDPMAADVVNALGGTALPVADSARAAYHAGAAIAGNHATALWAQVERVAAMAGVPAGAYWQLMRTSLENSIATSAAEAITGPASRADWKTCEAHLQAIGPAETDLYVTLASEAAALANHEFPKDLRGPAQ